MPVERPPSLPDTVAKALRDDIAAGRFAPGEQLPVEHRLVERFGVSRPVLREAVAQLKRDGLVETFQGRGVFVTKQWRARAFRIEPLSASERQDLTQIYELRIMIESGAASLAALRRTDKQILSIRRALDDIRDASSDADLVARDMRFHEAIAEAAGNRYVKDFAIFVDAQLRSSIYAALTGERADARPKSLWREHAPIYEAIARRDAEAARRAAMKHLVNAAQELSLDVFGAKQAAQPNRASARRARHRAPASSPGHAD